ncbi:MAG: hypothetical protein ACPGSW_00450 [Phaeobacter italicus]
MILTWPDTLPPPERNTWQLSPQDARAQRKTDAGPVTFRRRFSSAATTVSLSVVLTRSQRATFDRFFHDDCAEGTRLFWMPDPATDGWAALDAQGSPLMSDAGAPLQLGARWLCSFGPDLPAETIVRQVEFRKTFSIVVMP